MTKRTLRALAIAALAVLCIAVEEYFRWIGPVRNRTKQIATVVMLENCRFELNRYYEENGQYPIGLAEAVGHLGWFDGDDPWGYSLHYLSDEKMFILVSLGKDGRPDGTNYLAARLDDSLAGHERACSTFKNDQILSDRGWYRSCGK